jgi:hypothetical protein
MNPLRADKIAMKSFPFCSDARTLLTSGVGHYSEWLRCFHDGHSEPSMNQRIQLNSVQEPLARSFVDQRPARGIFCEQEGHSTTAFNDGSGLDQAERRCVHRRRHVICFPHVREDFVSNGTAPLSHKITCQKELTMSHSHILSSSCAIVATTIAGMYSMTAAPSLLTSQPAITTGTNVASAAIDSAKVQPRAADAPSADMTAEAALRKKVELLERGRTFLEAHGSYSAKLTKQEVVGGELLPEHVISMKCREEPFSVYLQWHTGDPGREVLYNDGENNGRLIGHDGGWKARLPALSLKPESSLAMRDSRYPVTKAGLGGLIDIMLSVHENDLRINNYSKCTYQPHVQFDGRDCDAFTTEYKNAEVSPTYRKSITLIDRERGLPISTQHYEWPQLGSQDDATTLVESYQFTEIDFQQHFSDADFSRDNEEYAFR